MISQHLIAGLTRGLSLQLQEPSRGARTSSSALEAGTSTLREQPNSDVQARKRPIARRRLFWPMSIWRWEAR